MLERRQFPRDRVYYGAMVAFNARSSTLACVVRNFSPRGARIEFENSAAMPEQVDFEIARRGLSCLARLVWCDRNAAGLAFSNVRESQCTADGRSHSAGLGAQAARDRKGKLETPLTPRSDPVRALDRMSTAEGEDARHPCRRQAAESPAAPVAQRYCWR